MNGNGFLATFAFLALVAASSLCHAQVRGVGSVTCNCGQTVSCSTDNMAACAAACDAACPTQTTPGSAAGGGGGSGFTPMQQIELQGAHDVGAAIGKGIVDLLLGNPQEEAARKAQQDQQKVLQEQQQLLNEQLKQQREAARRAAEERRFAAGKTEVLQSLKDPAGGGELQLIDPWQDLRDAPNSPPKATALEPPSRSGIVKGDLLRRAPYTYLPLSNNTTRAVKVGVCAIHMSGKRQPLGTTLIAPRGTEEVNLDFEGDKDPVVQYTVVQYATSVGGNPCSERTPR